MTCVVCYDNMDMLEYEDPKQSTETCFKLDCGHSFHTKCIINFLSKTEHECPTCNKIRPPEQKLEMEGLVYSLLKEIKHDPEVKDYTEEYKIAKSEYIEKITTLKKEIKEIIKTRSTELKILEHKNYLFESISKLKSIVKQKTIEKSNKHIAAYGFSTENRYCKITSFNRVFLGYNRDNYWAGWSLYRLQNPRLNFRLTNQNIRQEEKEEE